MNIPLHWPCWSTDFLLDGVVFLPDLSQVGPHADEGLMDRLLCLVPALLSSAFSLRFRLFFCPSFFLSVFSFSELLLSFLVAPPPLKLIGRVEGYPNSKSRMGRTDYG